MERNAGTRVTAAAQRCIHDPIQLDVGWLRRVLGIFRHIYGESAFLLHAMGHTIRTDRHLRCDRTLLPRQLSTEPNLLRLDRASHTHSEWIDDSGSQDIILAQSQ